MKLLENDIMEEMLEEYYASENQVFFDFVDAYGTGRDDTKIVDIILKLYRFARSYPWPEEWFKDCLCIYTQADIDTAEQNAAIGYLLIRSEDVLKTMTDSMKNWKVSAMSRTDR